MLRFLKKGGCRSRDAINSWVLGVDNWKCLSKFDNFEAGLKALASDDVVYSWRYVYIMHALRKLPYGSKYYLKFKNTLSSADGTLLDTLCAPLGASLSKYPKFAKELHKISKKSEKLTLEQAASMSLLDWKYYFLRNKASNLLLAAYVSNVSTVRGKLPSHYISTLKEAFVNRLESEQRKAARPLNSYVVLALVECLLGVGAGYLFSSVMSGSEAGALMLALLFGLGVLSYFIRTNYILPQTSFLNMSYDNMYCVSWSHYPTNGDEAVNFRFNALNAIARTDTELAVKLFSYLSVSKEAADWVDRMLRKCITTTQVEEILSNVINFEEATQSVAVQLELDSAPVIVKP